MNQRMLRCVLGAGLAAVLASSVWGQKAGPPTGGSQTTGAGPSAPAGSVPSVPAMQLPPFVYGRIVTESGSPLPNSTSVELRCGLQYERAIHPGLNGSFQFDLQGGPQSDVDMSAAVNPSVQQTIVPQDSQAASVGPGPSGFPVSACDLRISAPGYQPLDKIISLRAAEVGGLNVGVSVLSPLFIDESTAVNVNSLLIPKKARKEFAKGENDLRRNKLPSATRHFEKAVAEYGNFAAAWNDLGRVYTIKHQNDQAAQAFVKAIEADPQFISPYLSLADLQIQNSQLEDAAATAGKALEVRPGLAPAYYLRALADFRLSRFDAAEQSARNAEREPHQDIPQLHLLLADIFIHKRDFADAADEMRAYLKEFPNGQFASEVKDRLREIEKLATEAPAQPSNPGNRPDVAPESAIASPAKFSHLKIYLRMPDNSPFVGFARVRVIPGKGAEMVSTAIGSAGDVSFPNLRPGKYSIEANAPGFSPIQEQTDIGAGNLVHTLFLVLKPIPPKLSAVEPSALDSTPATNTGAEAWMPSDVDAAVPTVEPGVACPLEQVLHGASRSVTQLVEDLQKFDATEHLVQLRGAATGPLGNRDTRTFDYVAIVNHSKRGIFTVDEYRNGSVSPAQFPDEIATTGLPAMALVLHPNLVPDFNFSCEGLGRWSGHPTWLVHFAQRPDRPNGIRVYVIAHNYYPIPLKGRIWIDAASFQVRHLESDLLKPVPQIALTREHMSINYGPVEFYKHTRRLWLPLEAEIYWERQGRRFYRRHTFTNFKLFEVGVAQQIQPPDQSYCFQNTSDRAIVGVLVVKSLREGSAKDATAKFRIPPEGHVCKLVGIGKDLNIAANDVGSAAFKYDGPEGAVTADATLLNGSTLDLEPKNDVATVPR